MAKNTQDSSSTKLSISDMIEKLSAYLDEGEAYEPFLIEDTDQPIDRLALLLNEIVEQREGEANRRQSLVAEVQTDLQRIMESADRLAKNDFGHSVTLHSPLMAPLQGAFSPLIQQLRLQHLLMEMSSSFIDLPLEKIEDTIQHALGDLAAFVDADRSYVFDYNFDTMICSNRYEWCGPGVEPQIDALQEVPMDAVPYWVEKHQLGEPMFVQDVQALPEGPLRELLEPQEIKSLLTVPMMKGGVCVGFVGFDSVHNRHEYTLNEQRLLDFFAQLLVSIMLRQETESALRESNGILQTLTHSQTEQREEMARQFQEIHDVIDLMARGDFSAPVAIAGGQDIQPIVVGLETLRQTFQDMLNSLERSVAHLSSAATQFVVGARQQAHNANEQASSVNETNIAIHELAQMARESEQRTKEVIEVANRSESAYQEGHRAVEESIRGMNLLREQVESIAQTILNLSEKTQAVGDIISTVKDIAEQSKLLALNASIEAARAGDHGRGFKVVASEMRSLSTQSQQATNQVRAILNEILGSANKAVLVTESGSKQAEKGVTLASQAGEAMLILSEAIARSSDVAHQIAASVRQQVSGMSQMIEAIDTIHQSVQGSLDGAHQIEHSAVDLQTLAEELRLLVAKYRG